MKNIISVLKFLPLALVLLFVSCQKDDEDEVVVEVVDKLPQDGLEAGHGYVDLGLPSGTKWATCNVGGVYIYRNIYGGDPLLDENGNIKQEERADTHGYYFAWGEISPADSLQHGYYSSWEGGQSVFYNDLIKSKTPKTSYLWSYYKYGPASNEILKYNQREECGKIDNKIELDNYDDAAKMLWGGKWRMPTKYDLEELRKQCYWVFYENYNGTSRRGYVIFRAKKDSDKGELITWRGGKDPSYTLKDPHIFVRFSGFRRGSVTYNLGDEGTLWSSSLNGAISTAAHCIKMDDAKAFMTNCDRFTGRPIRAVFK